MKKIHRLNCLGCGIPRGDWHCDHLTGINRLYYVHSGTGGCRHGGKEYVFLPGHLYFIPFSEDFTPFSDPGDPILHSYADFERIPPLLTGKILSARPAGAKAEAAVRIFHTGAKTAPEGKDPMRREEWDGAFEALCLDSIFYLTEFIAQENGITPIEDPAVLSALEEFHQNPQKAFSVEELAACRFLNKDTFIRRFKSAVGMTPYASLKKLRLDTARSLRAQGKTWEDAAAETGYADAPSLLHALKNESKHEKVDF